MALRFGRDYTLTKEQIERETMTPEKQVELAKALVEELQSDELAEDLDYLCLLDTMAIMGIHLSVAVDSNVASEAYIKELASLNS